MTSHKTNPKLYLSLSILLYTDTRPNCFRINRTLLTIGLFANGDFRNGDFGNGDCDLTPFADTARGKVCDFAFLTSSGGKFYEFFMTVAQAIPPLTVKNNTCALIRVCALNRKNTVLVVPGGKVKSEKHASIFLVMKLDSC